MEKYTEKRPWGQFERFTKEELSTVKILTVNPKQRLSLQYHMHRKEFWRVLEGKVKITIGKKEILANPGDEFVIEPKVLHRIEALNSVVRILEISFGKFDENDIVRIEDDYKRV